MQSKEEKVLDELVKGHPILDQNQAANDDDEMSYEQFLVYSARIGEIDDVEEMIEVTGPPLDLNYQDASASMNTALHMAAANGHSEVLKLLLK